MRILVIVLGLAMGEKQWEKFNVCEQEPYELMNLSFALSKYSTQLSLTIENALNQQYFSVFVPEFEFPFTSQPLAGLGPKRFISIDLSHQF